MNILFRLLAVNLVLLVSINHNSYALEAAPQNVETATEIEFHSNEHNQKEIQEALDETIDEASKDAKNNQENANKNIIEANKIKGESTSEQLIKIAQSLLAIEQSRIEIAQLQLKLADDLDKTNENLDKISDSLKRVELEYLSKNLATENLKILYQEVLINWRVLVDDSLKVFSYKNSDLPITINKPSNIADQIADDEKNHPIFLQYQNSYQLFNQEYADIVLLQKDLSRSNKNYRANLLLQSGKLRADILQNILSKDSGFIEYNSFYIDDLIREIKLVPYRPIAVFYKKILQYSQILKRDLLAQFTLLDKLDYCWRWLEFCLSLKKP